MQHNLKLFIDNQWCDSVSGKTFVKLICLCCENAWIV